MKVADILEAKGHEVRIVQPWVSLIDAVRRMAGPPRIGALVVSGDAQRHVDGLITERDVVREVGNHGSQLERLRVADVMSAHVPVCSPQDSITRVMQEMTRSRYRHMPVVDGGELVGLVSIGDVVRNRVDEMRTETEVLRDLYATKH